MINLNKISSVVVIVKYMLKYIVDGYTYCLYIVDD